MVHKVLAVLAAAALFAGVGVAAAPQASAASPRRLVDYWYGDFLNLFYPSVPGSEYWVHQIEAGAEPSDVLWAIAHTRQYNDQQTNLWYSVYFGRPLDPGASYWVDGATAGRFPMEWVRQNVAASPEYTNSGSRPGLLIEDWFQSRVGSPVGPRDPSAGEVDYWAGRVRAVGPLAAYREIYYTPEAVTYRVEQWYHELLGRDPSPGELAYWSPKEIESDINVGVLIASTPEYAAQVVEVFTPR